VARDRIKIGIDRMVMAAVARIPLTGAGTGSSVVGVGVKGVVVVIRRSSSSSSGRKRRRRGGGISLQHNGGDGGHVYDK